MVPRRGNLLPVKWVLAILLCSAPAASSYAASPEEGKYFILSVGFEIQALPKSRVSIVSQMSGGNNPVGYGLSIKAFETSYRPQIYWHGGDGKGGFFTFGDFEFRPRQRYVMTIIGRPGEYISLYLEERGRVPREDYPLGEPSKRVRFLGGHELTGIATPSRAGSINFRTPEDYGEGRGDFAKVFGVFVANATSIPDSREKLERFLIGAPESIVKEIPRGETLVWEIVSEGSQ